MKKVARQTGPIVEVASKTFGPNQASFRTKKYSYVSSYRGTSQYYEGRAILEKDGFYKILTKDLHPGSGYHIIYICAKCKKESKSPRLIRNISKSGSCLQCQMKGKVRGPDDRQTGKSIIIPAKIFSDHQVEFKSREYVFVPASRKNISRYLALGYKVVDEEIKIKTVDLPTNSSFKIEYHCLRCDTKSLRPICSIKKSKCINCRNKNHHSKDGIAKQDGRIITIPQNHFRKGSPEFKTHEWIYLSATGRSIRLERLGYSPTDDHFRVRVKDLTPSSQEKILRICQCGASSFSTVHNIGLSKGCYSCVGNNISTSKLQDPKKIEKDLSIFFLEEYTSSHKRMEFRKNCGCVLYSTASTLVSRGVPQCIHDDIPTWKYFEILITNFLNGKKKYNIDCVTDNIAVEIKLTKDAIYNQHGLRDPRKRIREYKKLCQRKGLDFYVVVNAPSSELTTLPKYYLGWSEWKVIGLNHKIVKIGKHIKLHPHLYRRKILSKEDVELLDEYIGLCKDKKRYLGGKFYRQSTGRSLEVIRRIATGNKKASAEELAESLKLKLPLGANINNYYFKVGNKIYDSAQLAKITRTSGDYITRLFRKSGYPSEITLPISKKNHSRENTLVPSFRGKRVLLLRFEDLSESWVKNHIGII